MYMYKCFIYIYIYIYMHPESKVELNRSLRVKLLEQEPRHFRAF